jgi:hypothetical protein
LSCVPSILSVRCCLSAPVLFADVSAFLSCARDDIERAIKKLKVLGHGFSILVLDKRKLVQASSKCDASGCCCCCCCGVAVVTWLLGGAAAVDTVWCSGVGPRLLHQSWTSESSYRQATNMMMQLLLLLVSLVVVVLVLGHGFSISVLDQRNKCDASTCCCCCYHGCSCCGVAVVVVLVLLLDHIISRRQVKARAGKEICHVVAWWCYCCCCCLVVVLGHSFSFLVLDQQNLVQASSKL